MGIEENRRVAINYVQSMSKGAVDESVCHAGWTSWASVSGYIPREVFRDSLRRMMEFFPDGFNMQCLETTAEENRVSVRAKSHGVLKNGAVYENDYHFLFFFEGEQISQVREYVDARPIQEVLLPGLGLTSMSFDS